MQIIIYTFFTELFSFKGFKECKLIVSLIIFFPIYYPKEYLEY